MPENTRSNRISLAGVQAPRLDEYFGLWAIEVGCARGIFNAAAHMDLAAHVQQTPRRKIVSRMTSINVKLLDDHVDDGGDGKGEKEEGLCVVPVANADGKGTVNVAVIPVCGVLMKQQSSMCDSTSLVQLRRDVRLAAAEPNIQAILLLVDSPGGTSAGTSDAARAVDAATQSKPVWAFCEDLCASAAYFIASQADRVVANDRTAKIGSIGTFIGFHDFSRQAEAQGVEALVFSTGPLKAAGFDGAPVTDEQRQYFQSIVDQTQVSFSAAVKSSRGLSDEQLAQATTGAVFLADQAMSMGLIDAISDFESTLTALAASVVSATHKAFPAAQESNMPVEQPKNPTESQANVEQPAAVQAAATENAVPALEAQAQPAAVPVEPKASIQDLLVFKMATPEVREKMLVEGVTVSQAKDRYIAHLESRVGDLEQRLQTLPRGGKDPVEFQEAGDVTKPKKPAAPVHTDAKLASVIRMPKN